MTMTEESKPITETTAYLLGKLDERQETQGKQLDAIQAEQIRRFDAIQTEQIRRFDAIQTEQSRQFETIQEEQIRQGKVLAVIEEKVEAHIREHAESATGRRWLIRVGLVGAGIAATLAIQILPRVIQTLQSTP